MPALMGYDSDHPRALGEVGKCGVAIATLQDMQDLFAGIDLGSITTSMTINCTAPVALAMYIATAEAQGVSQERLGGTMQADMLKEYIAQKEWIYPPEPSMRIITDMMAYCAKHVPKWNTISISGYHIREAGSTAAQELAFTLADGFAYVEAGIAAGMDVDEFAPRLSFFFNSHSDFFEEIAKFRAARRIWARHMREKYGAKEPALVGAALPHADRWLFGDGAAAREQHHAHRLPGAGGSAWAARNRCTPIRSTKCSHCPPRRTWRSRCGRSRSSPTRPAWERHRPAGRLVLRRKADRRTRSGRRGLLPAHRRAWRRHPRHPNGFFQREIADAAYVYQREIENGERIVVGVNDFVVEEEQQISLLKIDRAIEIEQCERVQAYRASRDAGKVESALAAFKRAAESGENLMPHYLNCVKSKATLGEISEALVPIFGRYREPAFI